MESTKKNGWVLKPEKENKYNAFFLFFIVSLQANIRISSLTRSLHDTPKCFFWGGAGGSKILRFNNLVKKKKKCTPLGRHIHTNRQTDMATPWFWICYDWISCALQKAPKLHSLTDSLGDPLVPTALQLRHAQTVRDSSSSYKIDYVIVIKNFLNLKGHRFTGSKVTAILVRGRFCLLMELHREGSAPAACAAGLFYIESDICNGWSC